MVRGNWQRRVERTEALRSSRREQQIRRRSKRRSTSLGHEGDRDAMFKRLEEWIEENDGVLMHSYRGVVVDVWTDVRPSSRREYLPRNECVDDEEDEARGKGRKKDRGGFQKKGKQHPNAKNKDKANNAGTSPTKSHLKEEAKLLCSQEFYFGREACPAQTSKPKKGGRSRSNSIGDEDVCSLCHYHQFPKVKSSNSWVVSNMPQTAPLTLAQSVSGKYIAHVNADEERPVALPVFVREVMLQAAFEAVSNNANGEINGEKTMGMIYHSRIFVQNDDIEDDKNRDDNISNISDNDNQDGTDDESNGSEDDMDNNLVLQTLHQLLDDENLSPLNITYLSIQGVLIYDVHRGGLLQSDSIEQYLLNGIMFDANFGKIEESFDDECLHEQLTHHVLDEILSFLNDESTGVLPQVCRGWREEVGTRSPQLWKMLLGRRNWLDTVHPDGNDMDDETTGEAMSECRLYREAFISHYLAVRDVQSISNACNLLYSGNATKNQKKEGIEYAIQSFKATKNSPDFSGSCTVKIWPDTTTPRALAAYSTDCTLRLFEAVQGSSSKMICRQIVCVRASPPCLSRKKNKCEIVSMDLDENVVACLVKEMQDDAESFVPWITAISNNELICAGNEGIIAEECIQSFDVRAAVLDYIMGGSSSRTHDATVYDSLREPILQYLSVVDGDTSDILTTVTPKLFACGKGNFMFHALISIPGYSIMTHVSDDESLGSDEEARLTALSSVVPPRDGHRLFVISTQKGGVIVHSELIPDDIFCDDVFASRPFRRQINDQEAASLCINVVVVVRRTRNPSLWQFQMALRRDGTFARAVSYFQIPWGLEEYVDEYVCVHVTPSHVFYGMKNCPSIHIVEIETGDNSQVNIEVASHESFVQGATLTPQNIHVIHENYLLLIYSVQNAADEDEAFDGHWFGPGPGPDAHSKALIYHIPTGQIMHECSIPNIHLSMDISNNTIAVNAPMLGFVIAGANAREVARKTEDDDRGNDNDVLVSPSGKNPKGKKKRLAAKTAKKDKKDGFARGMSMRG